MSGHSHWARIKHKKEAQDAKKGKLFSKILRAITSCAQQGGGDLNFNPKLQLAVQKAKELGVNKETIEKAIKKGTGELEGNKYEEVTYEGYGPGGAAILIEALTDNKNRTHSEIKRIFERNNGSLAGSNSVAWLFERKGQIIIKKKDDVSEELVLEKALESGAEDVHDQGEFYEVIVDVKNLENVKKALAASKLEIESAEIAMIPKTTVDINNETAEKVINLLEALQDHDDVQNTYSNFNVK